MKDLSTVPHHKTSEEMVNALCVKVQCNEPEFFRVLVAYHFTKVASMMRTSIAVPGRGVIPINMYAIALAPSGVGKGHSTGILEDHVLSEFREEFLESTFPVIRDKSLKALAIKRAIKKDVPEEEEEVRVIKEFEGLGELAFSFNSATTPAVKQMRHKLLMCDVGSVNMEIDEIGSNLLSNVDVLTAFLELFDVGSIKPKLTKNTSESIRNEEIIGKTPTNMLLFGTPVKLLNGGKTEEEFISMQDTGYARRCFFAYLKTVPPSPITDAATVFKQRLDTTIDSTMAKVSGMFRALADPLNYGLTVTIPDDVAVLFVEYELQCKALAARLPEHAEMQKAEITHRYFKSTKLAGLYAFMDSSPVITEDHFYSAVKLAEESGLAFERIVNRERDYEKLAKYIATVGREVTSVDLMKELPFYKGSESARKDLLTLAIASGIRDNIIIRKKYSDGIEFLRGEMLTPTDTSEVSLSSSDHAAYRYEPAVGKFEDLHLLTQATGMNWSNHSYVEGHRTGDKTLPGFNLVVLDVDEGCSLTTAELLLTDYTYHIHTTKSHTDKVNRFRIVLPLSHTLKMGKEEYSEFMENLYEFLPFAVDTSTKDRTRKWACHAGNYTYNKGKLLDALDFIPATSKCDKRKSSMEDLHSLTGLERWFVNNTGTGNRSNQLIRYGLMLVGSGLDETSINHAVYALNEKLPDKLELAEVAGTILRSTAKAVFKRDNTPSDK